MDDKFAYSPHYRMTINKIVNGYRMPKEISKHIYDVYADFCMTQTVRTEDEKLYLLLMPELDPSWSYRPKQKKDSKSSGSDEYLPLYLKQCVFPVYQYGMDGTLLHKWKDVYEASEKLGYPTNELLFAVTKQGFYIYQECYWFKSEISESVQNKLKRRISKCLKLLSASSSTS